MSFLNNIFKSGGGAGDVYTDAKRARDEEKVHARGYEVPAGENPRNHPCGHCDTMYKAVKSNHYGCVVALIETDICDGKPRAETTQEALSVFCDFKAGDLLKEVAETGYLTKGEYFIMRSMSGVGNRWAILSTEKATWAAQLFSVGGFPHAELPFPIEEENTFAIEGLWYAECFVLGSNLYNSIGRNAQRAVAKAMLHGHKEMRLDDPDYREMWIELFTAAVDKAGLKPIEAVEMLFPDNRKRHLGYRAPWVELLKTLEVKYPGLLCSVANRKRALLARGDERTLENVECLVVEARAGRVTEHETGNAMGAYQICSTCTPLL